MSEKWAERRERLAHLLLARHCDVFLSAAPADVRYFTGSVDAAGILLVWEDASCHLIVPSLVAEATRASATDAALVAADLGQPLHGLVGARLHGGRARRVLLGQADPDLRSAVGAALGAAGITNGATVAASLRRDKDDSERESLRRAARACDQGLAAAMRALNLGTSELAVVAAAEAGIRLAGAEGTAFPTNFASGKRSAFPNARPTEKTLASGDMGFIDLGPLLDGYHADATRPFVLGQPTDVQRAAVQAILKALELGIAAIRPGARAGDLYALVADDLAKSGFGGGLPHQAGHGLGLFGAEAPWLMPGSADEIRRGDFIALEPGVYIQGVGGVRVEQDLMVTAAGCEVLTRCPIEPFVSV
jgi:Xaa-Pro aminopeptidase